MPSLNVSFLPKAVLRSKAAVFLGENELTDVPIDIEYVAECRYGMNIIPYSGLHREHGIDGFSASDFSAIYVDESVYSQRPTRLRFTVAHELGHRVLHKTYLDTLEFSTVDEWIDALDSLDREDYDRMEFQANAFAGLVLVPQDHLEAGFKEQLQLLNPQIDEAKVNGLTREDYLDSVVYAIADALLPRFDVSLDVVTIRIKTSEIDSWIP
jgi:hypothetical protein